jgi:hypothetical protein
MGKCQLWLSSGVGGRRPRTLGDRVGLQVMKLSSVSQRIVGSFTSIVSCDAP